MKATLCLIKQRRGEYGDGCFISPMKDSQWIIWLSFRVLYGWIMPWRNLYGKCHFGNGVNVPVYVHRISSDLLEIWMKIKYFVTLRAPSHVVRGNKVKISQISYIYEDLYSCEL
jgi:hypothetical protein